MSVLKQSPVPLNNVIVQDCPQTVGSLTNHFIDASKQPRRNAGTTLLLSPVNHKSIQQRLSLTSGSALTATQDCTYLNSASKAMWSEDQFSFGSPLCRAMSDSSGSSNVATGTSDSDVWKI